MARILKILSFAAIGLVLFLGVVLLVFYHLVRVGEFRRFVIGEFESRTQWKVRVGEVETEMGAVAGISFRDFALLQPESHRPVLTAQKVLIRVALLPLLKRKVVFYEIRFHQPSLEVVRDEQGDVPLLDFLVHLPFQERREAQFTLDLRAVKIEKGEVAFLDRQKGPGPGLTRLHGLDLDLRRAEKKIGAEQAAVEFALATTIETEGRDASLKSKGKILFFPGDGFELRRAWWEAEIAADNLPANLLREYYGRSTAVQAAQGTLSPRLRWQGRASELVQVTGEIDFRRVAVQASEIFRDVLTPGDGKLGLEMEWRPGEIRLPRVDLRSQELSLGLSGSFRSLEGGDSLVEFHVTTPFVPVASAQKYIPLKLRTAMPGE